MWRTRLSSLYPGDDMKIARHGSLAIAQAIIAAGFLTAAAHGYAATDNAGERRDGRDLRQDGRQDGRKEKVDCRQADQKNNSECRQDSRDNKQDNRKAARDIKY